MKIKKLIIFSLITIGISFDINAAYKETNLNGEWDFTFRKKADIDILPEASAYDIKLNVPDYICFNTKYLAAAKWGEKKWKKQSFVLLYGIAFYRKLIDIPEEWKGKSVQLYIGRALGETRVYVNGKPVSFYPYNYLIPSFTDLSGILKFGEKNEIVIAIDNSSENCKSACNDTCRFGGITSKLSVLVSNGPGRIENVYIRPGKTLNDIVFNLDLTVLKNDIGPSKVKWELTGWNSPEILAKGVQETGDCNGSKSITWETSNSQIKAWSPDAPYLYVVKIVWEKDGKTIDSIEQRFGIKRLSAEGRDLKFNGKPLYLRQLYTPNILGHARFPVNKKYWQACFQLLKEHGYNTVDWINVPSPEFFEAADETGIIVQHGIKGAEHGTVTEDISIWDDVALSTRIYPSVSIYCIGGELSYYDSFIDDVKKINEITKRINPESFLMPNQAMRGIEYQFSKNDRPSLKREPFPYHPERLAEISRCTDIFGSYPLDGTFSYWPFVSTWKEADKRCVVYERPLISHEIMESFNAPWSYPEDYRFTDLINGQYEFEYFCARYGYPKSRRQHGRAYDSENKIRYENINRLHSILCKYVFEKVRKCDNIAGYQDLGGKAGLNYFFENLPGYSPEKMRQYNNDSVLLLDFDQNSCLNHCYWENEAFAADIMISLFADKDIPYGILSWELKDGEHVLARNFYETGTIKNGRVGKLESVSFNWPAVKTNRKLNLKATFIGFGLNISNDWDFWVFRKSTVPEINAACQESIYPKYKNRYSSLSCLKENSPEKLWITDILTEKDIAHLEAGGDVLLLGGKPFPECTEWPTFNGGYRGHHTSGSVIYKHPIFENIPNEGWGDWQFYPLLEGARTIFFEDERKLSFAGSMPEINPKTALMKDIPFKPILEILPVFYQMAKMANIFEWKVGKGRLFVSTCVMDMNNPVCVTLLDAIFKYVSGPDFKPGVSVEPALFGKLLAGTLPVIKNNEIIFESGTFTGGSFNAKYSSFGCTPKDGVAISPKNNTTKAVFSIRKSDIPETSSSMLNLIVDGQDCDKEGEVKISILLNDKSIYDGPVKCVKQGWSKWTVPFKKELLKEGSNILEFRNTEQKSALGSSWFMIAGATITGNARSVSQKSASDKDVVPPVIRLLSDPPIEKYAHQIIGTTQTLFTVNAEDNASGINKLEISIDKEPFKSYAGAFKLEKGSHNLRCRCTDNAGNQTTVLKGILEGGTDAEDIDIDIRERK